jgi:hypothetical protein
LITVIYTAFYVWYGGSGDPISPEKVEKYIALFEERVAERNAEGCGPERGDFDVTANMRQFLETDDGQESVMLNLDVYLASMVRYRSRRDFAEFILTPEFSQDVDHKWAALSRSTAMATVPVGSFATIGLVPLLILTVVGLLLDRIGARRPAQNRSQREAVDA